MTMDKQSWPCLENIGLQLKSEEYDQVIENRYDEAYQMVRIYLELHFRI